MSTTIQGKALEFMREAHRSIDQRRKDNVRRYEVHPIDVVDRLFAAGVDDNVIIPMGYLHDVIEDVFPKNPFYSIELIEAEFGKAVAAGVIELTDVYTKELHPSLNRATRKQLERERYATFSDGAKLVKLADIASNLADDGTVLESDGRVEVGFNRMFIKEKAKCLPYLLKFSDTSPFKASLYVLAKNAVDVLEAQKKKFDVR